MCKSRYIQSVADTG